MAASASMPPTPQPSTPEAVDHRRVRVGADERVGIGHRERAACRVRGEDDAGQVFEIDLVDDAGVGRHDAEVLERLLAPAQEDVALAVARELEVGVPEKRGGAAELVDLHRVVDDELDGLERVDLAADRPPCFFMASRMAARSTTAGTPVKSCRSTRLGVKAISRIGSAFGSHSRAPRCRPRAPMTPSSVRSRFSSRILSENGSRAMPGRALLAAGRLWMPNDRSPTLSVEALPKLFFMTGSSWALRRRDSGRWRYGETIFSGRTTRSNSSAVMTPSLSAASLSVVPSWWASLATLAALS